jgi:hypothetical protein
MSKIQLTQEQEATVDDRDYEELSKVNWCANYNNKLFYAARISSRKDGNRHLIHMHRAIWEMHNGPIPEGFEIDHINRNGLDNRLENLRLCTNSQNHANQYRRVPHSSVFKGVSWSKQRKQWHSRLGCQGKDIQIGFFDSEIEAARAYDAKARELFGDFAKTNFKED